MMKTRSLNKLLAYCGEVIRLLLKYCIYWASAPSLHRVYRLSETVFSSKLHSAFRLDRKTRSQRSHVFRLTGTAALHCGHTFVGGILTANGQ